MMYNDSLSRDYILRARNRLEAVKVLLKLESWADVVRESQEVVEIALKALLRASGVEVPRIYDVGDVLEQNRDLITESLRPHIDELSGISRTLRRDRELAFCGSEDLTSSEFYRQSDAETALSQASAVVRLVTGALR